MLTSRKKSGCFARLLLMVERQCRCLTWPFFQGLASICLSSARISSLRRLGAFSSCFSLCFYRDLNPLYNVEADKAYKDKYYSELLPLVKKHSKLLPWGEKLTGESLQFFSPIVLWSKPESNKEVDEAIYLAFQDYIMAWTRIIGAATSETDIDAICRNKVAHHRYLTWRASKDPGRPVLRRLLGEDRCEHYIHEFLFNGLHDLGTSSFTEYFPEYRCEDGTVNTARSIIGKSYSERPWNDTGTFIHRSG
ncbi:hypothetical protein SELMODRAFT_151708 [Selaginella moellendorffii]|uniref:Uncharacterized protein HY2-2 n=1 Tax=Selaginella moellendorffii TaxID=88036 RepID=D8S1A3_SELML|nr:hypothetical protein SELMODRAFT_151708 [Selaginella moellendorffii]